MMLCYNVVLLLFNLLFIYLFTIISVIYLFYNYLFIYNFTINFNLLLIKY